MKDIYVGVSIHDRKCVVNEFFSINGMVILSIPFIFNYESIVKGPSSSVKDYGPLKVSITFKGSIYLIIYSLKALYYRYLIMPALFLCRAIGKNRSFIIHRNALDNACFELQARPSTSFLQSPIPPDMPPSSRSHPKHQRDFDYFG